MLELADVRKMVGPFDAESLVYPWANPNARLDALSSRVQSIAAAADAAKWPRAKTFEAIWKAAHEAAGMRAPEWKVLSSKGVAFLSEPWYCCAEPTKDQLVSLGVATTKKQTPAAITADSFI